MVVLMACGLMELQSQGDTREMDDSNANRRERVRVDAWASRRAVGGSRYNAVQSCSSIAVWGQDKTRLTMQNTKRSRIDTALEKRLRKEAD